MSLHAQKQTKSSVEGHTGSPLANDWGLLNRIKVAVGDISQEDTRKALLRGSRYDNGSLRIPLPNARHDGEKLSLLVNSDGAIQISIGDRHQPKSLSDRLHRDLERYLEKLVSHVRTESVLARGLHDAIIKRLNDGNLPQSSKSYEKKVPFKTADGGWDMFLEIPVSPEYAERHPGINLTAIVGIHINAEKNPTNFVIEIKSPERTVMGSSICSGPDLGAIPEHNQEALQQELKKLFSRSSK